MSRISGFFSHARFAHDAIKKLNQFVISVNSSIDSSHVSRSMRISPPTEKNYSVKKPASSFKSLALSGVEFSYEGGAPIFNKLNFMLKKGDFIGIQGKSGIGKSSLLYLLSGLYDAGKGKVSVNGKHVSSKKMREISILLPQKPLMFDGSIMENFVFSDTASLEELAKIRELLILVELQEYASFDTIKDYKISVIKFLSGGQQQRLAIARSLYYQCEILLLDEATNALDTSLESRILKKLSERDLVIVMVSHQESALKYCNSVYKVTPNRNLELVS